MSNVRSVKVMQVVIIESVIGDGKDNSPFRPMVEIFDMEGNKLDVSDYTNNGEWK